MGKKVYELASELSIGALDLVEKLKTMGMNVRNHMATLTDDEVERAKTALDTTPKLVGAAKKAVVRKVIRKAAQAAAEAEAAMPVQETTAADTVSVETASEEVAEKETVTQAEETEAPVVQAATTEVADEAKSKSVTVKRKTKAQKEEEKRIGAEAQIAAQNMAAAGEDDKKEYFREKMHSFTPVYIPPEEKAQQGTAAARKPVAGASTAVAGEEGSELEDDDSKNKKRMGDLAATMTKKVVATKTKDLTMMRADEELKYAAGLVGRAIYVPAKKKKIYSGPSQQTRITEVKDAKRIIQVHGSATCDELAQKLSVKFEAFANKMLEMNLLVKPEDEVGVNLATQMAALYNYRVDNVAFNEEKVLQKEVVTAEDKSGFPLRSPVVTIMGHVDHGKTSLLDHIRKTKVVDGEAGGITQHIGAYQVKVKDATLTFLDTPGHAAFAAMRQRGADVTDIVVLVVAADDGVMPQTAESIRFCKNANKPMIVAINKMDKPQANPDKVKQGLMEFGLTPEEWGGETIYVPVSALKGDGIDTLLENIQLQAEVMELRENPKGSVEGVVIESKIETGRGPVATILLQKGTLNKGDYIVVGETMGRARSLMDFQGKMLDKAGPSTPVQILGLEDVPSPGDTLNVVKNEREAKKIVENRINERKALANTKEQKKASLEDFFASAPAAGEEKKVLKIIVRTDVQGSFEAIKTAVERLGNSEVSVEVIGGGVGAITDNDVILAASSKGYVMGFNMRPVTTARRLAEEKGVDVKTYSIIYEMINEITLALEGMLAPEVIEKYIGRAQVKDTFNIPKVGMVAGAGVVDGKIERGCNIRLLRDGKIIYDGKLSTLKRFKDEVKEVKNGYECGLALENFNDIKVEDVVEAYIMEERKRTLGETQATL